MLFRIALALLAWGFVFIGSGALLFLVALVRFVVEEASK